MHELMAHPLGMIRHPIFAFGGHPFSLIDLVTAVAIVAAGYLLSRGAQTLLRRRLTGRMSLDHGVGYAVTRFSHYIVIAFSGLIALQSVGIDMSSLAVLGGFIGVGLGFGLQNLTSNFISGVILLIEQPVQVGDKITVGPHIGTVNSIGMRSTQVQTFDNVTLILPNALLIQELVINWTHGDSNIRMHVPFGVAYGTDMELLRKTVKLAAAGVPSVLDDPVPELRFLGFGDSSLDFEMLLWTRDPLNQFKTKSDLYFSLEAGLRAAGIEIPFPQRVLRRPPGQRP